MLRKERDVLQAQVEALQASARTRILQLRSNPASEAAAIKQATLNALRAENADLLAQLENMQCASPDAADTAAAAASDADDAHNRHLVNKGNNSGSSSSSRSRRDVRLVPLSALENVRQQVRDTERLVAERDKRMRRLKQAWEVQSLEFRKAVASILGWKVDLLPDGHGRGRVRVTPMFYADAASRRRRRDARTKRKPPGTGGGGVDGDVNVNDDDDDDDDEDDDGDKTKHSIVFDREKNSVHVPGAPDGEFAREIQPLVRFWLDQRDDIPCFLAAATLEYYDRTTRATRAASAGAAST
jgi:mitotic spindle assembly checkpoint protein MAD1